MNSRDSLDQFPQEKPATDPCVICTSGWGHQCDFEAIFPMSGKERSSPASLYFVVSVGASIVCSLEVEMPPFSSAVLNAGSVSAEESTLQPFCFLTRACPGLFLG